jgi:hypothetical protein
MAMSEAMDNAARLAATRRALLQQLEALDAPPASATESPQPDIFPRSRILRWLCGPHDNSLLLPVAFGLLLIRPRLLRRVMSLLPIASMLRREKFGGVRRD